LAKELLIIFIKNPEKGRVKTRLAHSVGEVKALSVYQKLLWHTRQIVSDLVADKCVAYSNYINQRDIWENDKFRKCVQLGEDLGSKMQNAIAVGFKAHYDSICLIGSDIFELTSSIIEQAFHDLHNHDLVLGPALDGGYYLIGMNRPLPELFKNIPWGSEQVLDKTLDKAAKHSLRISQLPTLNDIDTIGDIRNDDRAYLLS
jgi:rSAM/selenodomain-associated transferase 1